MRPSDRCARDLADAVEAEIRAVEHDMGADGGADGGEHDDDVDAAARVRAVAGAAITSLIGALSRKCLEHRVNPLHALLDGLLLSVAVELQEAGIPPDQAAENLAQRFLASWTESAAIDVANRARAH